MASSVVHAWGFVYDVSSGQQLSTPLAICYQLQLVRNVFVMVQYTLEQHVFLYDTATCISV
jgi:hypothetical protein